jgi:flagellar hook-associated protein 2
MGVVGLSFGSPTSGAGFNVSTTVSSIVANLQNVETPWKTQLTALESQDTTISSLGTLFSNLSNDMSTLTDLEGILAQKTGSSSDTNVLTLTAANSTAFAGTHVVEVGSLAKTSSGYLNEISSASASLTGEITLQTGAGAAVTIDTSTMASGTNTLAGLAKAINASTAGVIASVLTDATGSRLSLVSGTSGAGGNIAISANTLAATSTTLSYAGVAGSTSANSTGTLTSITNATDVLTGTMTIQVGSGTTQNVVIGAAPSTPAANTIYTGSGINTLAGIAGAIQSAGIGVSATVVQNSDGSSSLSLTSGTGGTKGTLSVASSIVDTSNSLGYTNTVTGADAQITVDGVNLTSASNTVANLIPGVTFQLLAPSSSGEQVQVVIGNDNTGVESTTAQMVSDYNSLISAINAQQGNTSSGTPEPLFGSPTLSLLQQQLLSGLNMQSPSGYLDSISASNNSTLAGSMTIKVGSTGTTENIVIGAVPSTGAVANTFYTGSITSDTSITGIAAAINSLNVGVTAGVATSNGDQTLTLASQTEGAVGVLSVTSAITATGATALTYADQGTDSTEASGLVSSIAGSSDILSGSISIQAGSGTAENIVIGAAPSTPLANTVYTGSGVNTLAGLCDAINGASIGVTASVTPSSGSGPFSLSLVSQTSGSGGSMNITSKLLDTTNLQTTNLAYTSSSDITSLTTLGVSVGNDGSMTLDAASLDSLLNTDYNGVVGFFQNINGWGQSFATTLTDSGTTEGTGVLALASSSNSNIESTLNADISKEELQISAQQKSLTAELNSANEVMQAIPTQIQGVNELYSAITGYNSSSNG